MYFRWERYTDPGLLRFQPFWYAMHFCSAPAFGLAVRVMAAHATHNLGNHLSQQRSKQNWGRQTIHAILTQQVSMGVDVASKNMSDLDSRIVAVRAFAFRRRIPIREKFAGADSHGSRVCESVDSGIKVLSRGS